MLGSLAWTAGHTMGLLPGHSDVDSFLRRDEVIDAYRVFGNGELDALDATRKFVPVRPIVR